MPSFAVKKSVPLTFTKLLGDDVDRPGAIVLTIDVPSLVPFDFQSSSSFCSEKNNASPTAVMLSRSALSKINFGRSHDPSVTYNPSPGVFPTEKNNLSPTAVRSP